MIMAVAPTLSLDVQELIARISIRIMQTDEIVAATRALARETLHLIRPGIAASQRSDSSSCENDWAAFEITARREPVQS
jgi:hypothetical protein